MSVDEGWLRDMSIAHAESQSLAAAEAAFRRDHPRYDDTAVLDELRRSDFARLDARRPRLPRLHRRRAVRGVAAGRAHAAAARERVRQPSFNQPNLGCEHRARWSAPGARARVLQRLPRGVRRDLHAQRHRRTSKLVGEAYPFCAGDRFLLTFDNHNSVNGIREFARAQGRGDDLRAERRARSARRREPAAALPDRHARRSPQPLRLPRAVELLRRAAPAGVDRASPCARLGRAARRRRLRAHEPARPRAAGTPISWRSRSTRCSATRPESAV